MYEPKKVQTSSFISRKSSSKSMLNFSISSGSHGQNRCRRKQLSRPRPPTRAEIGDNIPIEIVNPESFESCLKDKAVPVQNIVEPHRGSGKNPVIRRQADDPFVHAVENFHRRVDVMIVALKVFIVHIGGDNQLVTKVF